MQATICLHAYVNVGEFNLVSYAYIYKHYQINQFDNASHTESKLMASQVLPGGKLLNLAGIQSKLQSPKILEGGGIWGWAVGNPNVPPPVYETQLCSDSLYITNNFINTIC